LYKFDRFLFNVFFGLIMVQCSYVFEVSLMALMIVYILNSIVPTVG